MKKNIVTILIALTFSMGTSSAQTSQNQKEPQAVPSKELREQMATAHEKIALCLRSEASVQECHQQMREQCKNMRGKEGCFMMDHMGNGMMGHQKKRDSTKGK